MRVLAVDPGGTTGWAICDEDHLDLVATGQERDQFAFCRMADRHAEGLFAAPVDVIVCESYTVTPRTIKLTREYSALEIIGTLRYIAGMHGKRFKLQPPASAKNFMTNDRLRSLGWWRPGEDHARDALRHLGLFLAEERNNQAVLSA